MCVMSVLIYLLSWEFETEQVWKPTSNNLHISHWDFEGVSDSFIGRIASRFQKCVSVSPLDGDLPGWRLPRFRPTWTETHLDRDPLKTETPSRQRTPLGLTSSGCHRSGRYASYWNAYLFSIDSSTGRSHFSRLKTHGPIRLFLN